MRKTNLLAGLALLVIFQLNAQPQLQGGLGYNQVNGRFPAELQVQYQVKNTYLILGTGEEVNFGRKVLFTFYAGVTGTPDEGRTYISVTHGIAWELVTNDNKSLNSKSFVTALQLERRISPNTYGYLKGSGAAGYAAFYIGMKFIFMRRERGR